MQQKAHERKLYTTDHKSQGTSTFGRLPFNLAIMVLDPVEPKRGLALPLEMFFCLNVTRGGIFSCSRVERAEPFRL